MLRSLLTRLRRQDGIALPTVMGSLLLTTTLATTTLVVSLDGNQTSIEDRDAKRANAAAQAAIERAFLLTTQRAPAANECVVENPLVDDQTPVPVAGECPQTTTTPDHVGAVGGGLGNGATMTWAVGTEGAAGCRDLPNDPRPANDPTRLKDRCITASATVNGVTRRMQSRILYLPPVTPWKQAGLVGKNSVELGNNATINSPVGTNGTVSAGANTDVTGNLYLPPASQGGSVDFHHQADYGDRVNFKWEFPAIDWETPRQDHANAEARLISAITSSSYGGVTYDPATKILHLNSGTLTLPGGLYHVCGVTGGNGATIIVPSDQKASLWIDSERGASPGEGLTGSGCVSNPNTGRLNLDKNNMLINADGAKNPAELQVFVFGTTQNFNDQGTPDVVIKNGTQFYGTIWAPDSNIDFKNNGAVGGGITGKNLDLKNNGGFTHDSRIFDMPLPGTGVAKRRGWFECDPQQPVATDPESGCQ